MDELIGLGLPSHLVSWSCFFSSVPFVTQTPCHITGATRDTIMVLPFQASTLPLFPSVNAYSFVVQDMLHMHHTSVESGVRQKPNQSHDSGVGPQQVDAPYEMTQET